MTEQILDHLAEKIEIADAILIGAGSGLSSAAGYDHYHWSPALLKALAQFQEYYRFPSPFAGFYHCFSSYGAQWAYYSQYIRFMWEAPIGQPYLDLKKAVGSKPAFILTTNVDMQVSRLFSKEQVCTFQGDFGFCQCSQPCHDQIWTNYGLVQRLTQALDGVNLPEEMVPRCPDCGRVLIPWVRDDTFLEGSVWQEGVARYHAFLRHWLTEQSGKKLLLLELGVGEMTPSIIKLPFWQLAAQNEDVFYACLNQKDSHAPEHLKGKSLYLQGDLAETLSRLRQRVYKTE